MLETAVQFLSDTTLPLWILLGFAVLVSFVENVFPPAPGDSIIVFMGGLISFGKVDFLSLLIFTSIGSTLGFSFMYWLGNAFGQRVVDSNRFKFINQRTLHKPRLFFKKWGYWLIVANRFLSGTRAVISFFAGITKLNFSVTIVLSFFSALVWNSILIYLGIVFGDNWRIVDKYISLYGYIILPIAIAIVLFFVIRWIIVTFVKKKKDDDETDDFDENEENQK